MFIESQDEQPTWIAYVLKKWNEEVFPNVVQGTHLSVEGQGNNAEEAPGQNAADHLTNHLMRLRVEDDPVDSSASNSEEEFPALDDEQRCPDIGEIPSLRLSMSAPYVHFTIMTFFLLIWPKP